MRKGRLLAAADHSPEGRGHAPADEGSVAKERAGQAEEGAFLLGLGFDPPVVAQMLARDLAGVVAARRKRGRR